MSNPTATLNFPVPSALGTIDQYVTAVNKYPLLTPEQEQELGLRWKYMQDVDSARQLVMSHLRRWSASAATTWATACRRAT